MGHPATTAINHTVGCQPPGTHRSPGWPYKPHTTPYQHRSQRIARTRQRQRLACRADAPRPGGINPGPYATFTQPHNNPAAPRDGTVKQGTPSHQPSFADALLQGPPPTAPPRDHDIDFQRQFWSTIDLCGWTGSVAGAVLFLLTQVCAFVYVVSTPPQVGNIAPCNRSYGLQRCPLSCP